MAHLTLEVADLPKRGKHLLPGLIRVNKRVPVPYEWLGQLSDALLAQSAIDRLKSAAYELVLEGESYRSHEKPGLPVGTTTPRPRRRRRS